MLVAPMGLNFFGEKWIPVTVENCTAFWSPFSETCCVFHAQMSCVRFKEQPADTCTVKVPTLGGTRAWFPVCCVRVSDNASFLLQQHTVTIIDIVHMQEKSVIAVELG